MAKSKRSSRAARKKQADAAPAATSAPAQQAQTPSTLTSTVDVEGREREQLQRYLGITEIPADAEGLLNALRSRLERMDRAKDRFEERSRLIEDSGQQQAPLTPITDLTIGQTAVFYYLYGLVALRGPSVIERVQAESPADETEELLLNALHHEFTSPAEALAASALLDSDTVRDVTVTSAIAPWLNTTIEAREALLDIGRHTLSALQRELTAAHERVTDISQQLAAAEDRADRLQRKADERTAEAQRARGDLERAQATAERELGELREQVSAFQAQLKEAERRSAERAGAAGAVPVVVGGGAQGRGVYSSWMQLTDPAQFDQLVADLGGWVADQTGTDDPHLREFRAGRRVLRDVRGDDKITVDALQAGGSRLWELTWQQPFEGGDGERLRLHVQLTAACASPDSDTDSSGQLWVGVHARLHATAPKIMPVNYEFTAPSVIADVVDRYGCVDGNLHFRGQPFRLTADEVPAWATAVLDDPRRTRPVIVVADYRPRATLARAVAQFTVGLAHTFQLADADAEMALLDRLGRERAVWGGGVRVYFRGADDDGRSDWLYTRMRVQQLSPTRLARELSARLSAAAVMALRPPAVIEDTRTAALAAHRSADDGELPERWARELDQLRGRLADAQEQLADAHAEIDRLVSARRAERRELERLRSALQGAGDEGEERAEPAAGGGAQTTVDGSDLHAEVLDDLPDVRTVAEAVEEARRRCQHLIFTDRTLESAQESPFQNPKLVLRDLLLLDRVAAAYANPDGVGMSMTDYARQLGLEWRQDVGGQWLSKYPGLYSFRHSGHTIWVKEHIRVANGAGATRLARIYFRLVDGSEPEYRGLPRGVYVGPVGRKLPDSTTG